MKDIFSIQERVNRLFDDVLASEGGRKGSPDTCWSPRVDIYELDDAFIVNAELPGVEEDQVEIRIEGRIMTITGQRPSPSSDAPGEISRYHIMENSYGPFRRDFSLPDDIDKEGITARLQDGLLQIRLPKHTPPPGRQIRIE